MNETFDLLPLKEQLRTGYAGVINNEVVDRRTFPQAKPIAENPRFRIPAPREINAEDLVTA